MKLKTVIISLISLEILYVLFSFYYPIHSQLKIFVHYISISNNQKQIDWKNKTSTFAFNPQTLEVLSETKKTFTVSANLFNTYEGKISNILFDNELNAKFPLIFKLTKPNGASNIFYISLKDLSKLSIYRQKDNKEVLVPISELKEGESIVINEIIDLTKPIADSRNTFKITLI